MKKCFLLLLTLALIGAGNPVPLSALNSPPPTSYSADLTATLTVTGTTDTISGHVSTGHDINISGGGKLIIVKGGSLTIDGTLTLASQKDSLKIVSTGELTLNGTVENKGVVLVTDSAKVTLANGSTVQNDSVFKVDPVTTGYAPRVDVAAGATILNNGVMNFTAGNSGSIPVLYNSSADVSSPGLIVLNGNAIGAPLNDLKAGFIKVPQYSGANLSYHKIEVYGTGNVWTSLLNDSLRSGDGKRVELHIRDVADLTIPEGKTLTLINGDSLYIRGRLNVNGTVLDSGRVTLTETADVRISKTGVIEVRKDTVIAQTGAYINNAGTIKVTQTASTDSGTFANKSNDIISTGLIVVYGDHAWLGSDSTLQQGVVVNIGHRSIDVCGTGNNWTDKLQEYLTNGQVDSLFLTSGKDRLTLTSDLTVPSGRTLIIADHSADKSKVAAQPAIVGDKTIKSEGLTVLNYLPLANVTVAKEGFFETIKDKVITVYGTSSWSAALQTAFGKADSLFIPEGATLDFSPYALNIPEGKKLLNEGTLTGGDIGDITVRGTLYKGKESTNDYATLTVTGSGKINTQLDSLWISLPTAPYSSPFVLSYETAAGRDTLTKDTHYTVTTNGGTATIAGKPATGTAQYGYYGNVTRGYWAVTAVALNKDSLSLAKGDTITLLDTVKPISTPDSVNQAVTWTSSAPTVATVSTTGKVTAVAKGEAKIYVTTVDGSQKDSCAVTVTEPVQSVKISAGRDTIVGQDTTKLTVEVSEGASTDVKVESGDTARIAVTGSALVWEARVKELVKKDTTVYITVTSNSDPTKKDSVGIVLRYVRATGVTIAATGYDLAKDSLQKADSLQLSAEVAPDSAANKAVTWTSLNTGIATVDKDGKVKGVARGEAKIVVTAADDAKPDTITIKVYDVAVTGVSIANKATIQQDSLQVGKTKELTANVIPAGANNTGFTWASTNDAVATVTGGVVTAVASGEAEIVVTANGYSFRDTIRIKVYTRDVEGIYIDSKDVIAADSLPIRGSRSLTATVEPTDATDQAVTWESRDESIASVDAEGKVTAHKAGYTYIVATSVEKGYTDSVKITVYWVDVASVSIVEDYPDSIYVRETLQLSHKILPDNATDKGVVWSSDKPEIAQVDSATGKVTAVSAGVAEISVTTVDGNKKAGIPLKVYAVPVDSVRITAIPSALLKAGEKLALSATVYPAHATLRTVTWRSDNEIAAVNDTGLVTAGAAAGEAVIYVIANDPNCSDNDSIVITVDTVSVTGVTLAAADTAVGIGETLVLTVKVLPDDATNKAVRYESSDEAVATVADGTVTGVSEGEATIYVTTVEGEYTDSVTITVYPIAVTGVTIAGADSVGVGETLELTATIAPANATDKAVTWTSSNEAIATVAGGIVTGVSEGEADIIVTAEGGYADTLTVKVYPIAVTGVTIAEGDGSVGIGETLELTATVAPANATNKAVTWTSDNEAIATVADGIVTGVSEGEATITVTTGEGEYTAGVTITVYPIPVTGVTIAEGAGSVAVGETLELTATVAPANATNKAVTWTSSNEAIATVAGGIVTGVSEGEATITVTTDEGEYIASVAVEVYTVPVEGVSIAASLDSLPIGFTTRITATVTPENATNKAVIWTSSDEAIATVADGTVTGVAAGEVTIYVTTVGGEYTDSVTIAIYPIPVEDVTIAAAIDSVAVGDSLQLTAEVTPDVATDKAVTWSSSDEAVATVSEDGLVTGVAAGEATIYVTTVDGEYKDSVAIKVYPVAVEGVIIAAAIDSIAVGDTLELIATVTPDNATDKAVTWTSGNEEVAVVSEDGVVTGVAAGEAYIYVTTKDGGLTDSTAIKVYTVAVTGVTIADAADSLAAGSTSELTATIEPANATNKAVIWESSDEAVATVEDGVVTGVADGEATIYVTTEDGEYRDSIAIEVYTVAVEGVKIAAAADSVATGDTLELTATIEPANASNKAVIWESSDEAVATVEDGVVTGVADGEATIYVTTEDGEYRDSVTLKVYTIPVPVTGVTIADATDSLATGKTLQLTAAIEPEGANVDYETAWESSDEEVATVDETGLVIGVADGSATITLSVTTEDSVYTAEVTIEIYTVIVVPKITKVEIASDSANLIITTRPEGDPKGNDIGKVQLEAVVTTESEGEVDYVVAWSSNKEAVAVVDEEGLVTAVGDGTATITLTVTETATGETFTATLDISITTVGIAPVPVTSVKAYIADNTLYVNSAVTEKVDIYTISGKLVYSAVKPAGEVQINLTNLSDGVLIIRGASGWVRKVVK